MIPRTQSGPSREGTLMSTRNIPVDLFHREAQMTVELSPHGLLKKENFHWLRWAKLLRKDGKPVFTFELFCPSSGTSLPSSLPLSRSDFSRQTTGSSRARPSRGRSARRLRVSKRPDTRSCRSNLPLMAGRSVDLSVLL